MKKKRHKINDFKSGTILLSPPLPLLLPLPVLRGCFRYLPFAAASTTCPSWLLLLLVPHGHFRYLPLVAASAACPCGCFRYLPLVAASTSLPPTLLPLPSLHHGPHTRMLWMWKLGSCSSELSLKPGIMRPSHPTILRPGYLHLLHHVSYLHISLNTVLLVASPLFQILTLLLTVPVLLNMLELSQRFLHVNSKLDATWAHYPKQKCGPLPDAAPLSLIPKAGKPGCNPRRG
ncbi:hypothetical protein K503DRAFT_434207 [Rhizopogon vinicolor AM-OR11-026]|uniref:Uncharacterized protein n=1 Tax=Rhizopogon vinicolor AM-OR11-026 TaxID=1314800 RepID=A0A1B7MPP7_9AGAM|nr:hypothetical protein K503DRAFT_434207 [Rhizopogon vinicolor AM-OR11-026]